MAAASLLTLKHYHGAETEISSDVYQVEVESQRAIRLFRSAFPDRPLADLPNSPLHPALA